MAFNLEAKCKSSNMFYVQHELTKRLIELTNLKVKMNNDTSFQAFNIQSHIKDPIAHNLFHQVNSDIQNAINSENPVNINMIFTYPNLVMQPAGILNNNNNLQGNGRELIIYGLYCLYCLNERIERFN